MATTTEHVEISDSVAIADNAATALTDEIVLNNEKPWLSVAVSVSGGSTVALADFTIKIKTARGQTTATDFDGWIGTNNLATTAHGATESATIFIGNVYSIQLYGTLASDPASDVTVTVVGVASRHG